MSGFIFSVPGKPTGKGRPRFTRGGHTFTPAATVRAESDVLGRWIGAGEPRIDGPVALDILIYVERPKGHYRRDGETLSAEGLRHPYPDAQKPDVDNVLKLVMDALNTRAWSDDVRVVDAHIARRWGPRSETVIRVDPWMHAEEGAA